VMRRFLVSTYLATASSFGATRAPRVGVLRRMASSVQEPALAPAAGAATTLKQGDYVAVEWSIAPALPEEVAVFDEGLVRCVVGGGGFLPALHEALLKTSSEITGTAETHAVTAPFGQQDPRMGPVNVPSASAPAGLKPGDKVRLSTGATATVTKVTDAVVTIDANHPLAGVDLDISVTLKDVFDAATALETATFAGGCFWGLELAFQREPGVITTSVGYAQGALENPSYEAVCSGTTGHTEAVQVRYDPSLVSYARLCELFWDRLGENRYALNRVGNDMGTQYRHGIYFHSDEQRAVALASFEAAQAHDTDREVVTELEPVKVYWEAEEYHQQYLQKGGQSAKKTAVEPIRCYG